MLKPGPCAYTAVLVQLIAARSGTAAPGSGDDGAASQAGASTPSQAGSFRARKYAGSASSSRLVSGSSMDVPDSPTNFNPSRSTSQASNAAATQPPPTTPPQDDPSQREDDASAVETTPTPLAASSSAPNSTAYGPQDEQRDGEAEHTDGEEQRRHPTILEDEEELDFDEDSDDQEIHEATPHDATTVMDLDEEATPQDDQRSL